ncbi:MAG TPA: riboflavin synthase [Candidatus Marinimicrobia bacterium]|nr:riboflavin synthase [Candidatus Neomarinimicrobiota bacterium]
MFTGLIEEIGKVERIQSNPEGKLFEISSKKVIEDLHIGDSISVDGVCLSVVYLGSNRFSAQAVLETLERSTLKYFKAGTMVNLERALTANGRFGGHFVQGHVDGIGRLMNIQHTGKSAVISIQVPGELSRYIVPKGSLALNGISLTVAGIVGNSITVSVIPISLTGTNLSRKKVGDYLNIEVDILAKYIEKIVTNRGSNVSINEDRIKQWGYGK